MLLAAPGAAHASGGGELTGEAAALFSQFLEQVESMGPAGAVLFVVVVMLFEMVPLFPTQPLSLASGLLFGAQNGALLMLLGVTLAAFNAFMIARGVGRPLAQRVIDAEMGHTGEGEAGNAIAKTMASVQAAIDQGGLWKQMTAVVLLRLTPVVPFSASNYLLGLTPVQVPAFVGGTVVGMSVWSALYASLGGASRALLDGGADMDTLLADMGRRASALSSDALGLSVGLAGALVLAYVTQRAFVKQHSHDQPHNGSNGNGGAATNGKGGVVVGVDDPLLVAGGAGRPKAQQQHAKHEEPVGSMAGGGAHKKHAGSPSGSPDRSS